MFSVDQPVIMGILNITPDSFSDGGSLYDGKPRMDAILASAETMLKEGASILDVGGESTRPGAEPVTERQELERVIPVLEALRSRLDCALSVDTSTPAVMQAALELGVDLVNDVRALRRPGALETVSASETNVCLMHTPGEPDVMQQQTDYRDVVAEVGTFLQQRVSACEAAGIARNRICIDPGFGFGKTTQQNLQLLAGLPQLAALGLPVLVGLSRKSLIGKLTGREVQDRVYGSVCLALLALQRGATILRVHDVGPTSDMVKIWLALNHEETASE